MDINKNIFHSIKDINLFLYIFHLADIYFLNYTVDLTHS